MSEQPIGSTNKKSSNQIWTWIIALAAFLIAKGFVQYYNDHKAYKTVRSVMPDVTAKLNNLSQDEQNRIYELRESAYQIIINHLEGQEREEYVNLINGGMKVDADYERHDFLFNKVKPKLNKEEKAILNDFYQVVRKLSSIKAKEKLF